MIDTLTRPETVIRTERGLSIAGTRITLYNLMDYLKAGWPPALIGSWLNLSAGQMTDALEYIAAHQAAVEAEYQTVVQHSQANRDYWEARNRNRRARTQPCRPNRNRPLSKPNCKPAKPNSA